jgi:hypothetical protein
LDSSLTFHQTNVQEFVVVFTHAGWMNVFRTRSATQQHEGSEAAMAKGPGKVDGGSSRGRRALGDITNNASVSNDAKGRGKSSSTKKNKDTMDYTEECVDAPVRKQHRSMASDEDMAAIANDTSRPYMQRDADDIDTRDAANPLLCTDVVTEMYDHFCDLEQTHMVNASYMSTQSFINEKMRTILVDWLVEVHLKFKMVPETLYLTVNIIDRCYLLLLYC